MKLRIQILNSHTGLYYSNLLSYCLQDRITGARHKSSTLRAQLKKKTRKEFVRINIYFQRYHNNYYFPLTLFQPFVFCTIPFALQEASFFSRLYARGASAREPQEGGLSAIRNTARPFVSDNERAIHKESGGRLPQLHKRCLCLKLRGHIQRPARITEGKRSDLGICSNLASR